MRQQELDQPPAGVAVADAQEQVRAGVRRGPRLQQAALDVRELECGGGGGGHGSCGGRGGWKPARLEVRGEPYAWQDWSCEWTVTRPGRYTLRARATDVAGNRQPDVPPWNRLGCGNTAVEVRFVDVR